MTLPDGWLNTEEADLLRRLAQDRVVLELGTWKGRSTVAMAATAKYILTVDHHRGLPPELLFPTDNPPKDGDTLTDYLSGIRDLPNVGSLVAEFSAVELLNPSMFEFVFLDGLHDLASTLADLALIAPFGRPFALHDWWGYETRPAAEQHGLGDPSYIVSGIAVFE